MHTLFEKLRPFIRWVTRHPGLVVVGALVLTVLALSGARHLRIDPDFANLLPADYASVQALETLRATVGGESEAAVAIQSPSFAANKAFAEALIPRVLELRPRDDAEPFFRRVDYRRDTDFLQRNALYFATDRELDEIEDYLLGLQEEARLEANPFYFDLGDDFEEEDAPPEEDDAGARLEASYERIVGQEYPVSPDSTVLVLRFYPSGSQTTGNTRRAYERLDALIAEMEPAGYHPEMQISTAGRLYRQLVEVQSIQDDVLGSFGAGALAVLLSVLLYFSYKAYHARVGGRLDGRVLLTTLARAPALALVIAAPLLMSLSWTGGIAYLAFEALNLMTATLGLVLFGLGIDYGIHFYARYTEERGRGFDPATAVEHTFTSTAQAITIGALSTAAALYVIVFADFKGFSEFGFIAGTGVLLALVSMTVVMPALLVLFEKWRVLNLSSDTAEEPYVRVQGRMIPAFRPVVVGSLLAVVLAVVFLPRVAFEYNFSTLEPEYEAYEARNAPVREVFQSSGRRNPAYIVTETPEEIPAIIEAVEARAAADSTTLISEVESLQQRFPTTPADAQRRLDRIAYIRGLLQDDFLTAEPNADLERLRLAASTTDPVTLDEVPESIRKQYTTKSGEIGNFVLIYPDPDRSLSDGRNSIQFSDEVGTITTEDGTEYHAGSTSLVAADMLRLMQREAPFAVGATFLMVMLLMFVNFRSVRWAFLAMIPLVVGVLWMLLGMEFLGLKLNFYNLVVLPAVLGIGNDAGVHIVHRYREEGPGSLRYILRSTGEHVFMSSLTTMIGFGGLLLSFHPGLRSIGQLAVLGIGTTLLAALIFLPALLQWMESRSTSALAE